MITMNDEVEINEVVTKRKGGWPKGRQRAKRAKRPDWDSNAMTDPKSANFSDLGLKMKARPNWESDDFGRETAMVDRLKIPAEKIDQLRRDGFALQWITKSVRGMDTPKELTAMTRGGWTPVHQSDFDSALDGMFLSKGVDEIITVDDCMLVARPLAIHEKAKAKDQRAADYQANLPITMLKDGVPRVSGARHPTIRNQINVSMERIEIPEDGS